MKPKKHSLLFLCGVLILLGTYLFPLWKISLTVPQYPKDIYINIWLNKLENGSKKALEIMNVLNHNIGMKAINQEDFKELEYFPVVLAFIIISGLGTLFLNFNYRIIWICILLIGLGLALLDFYLWLRDFGQNLDPEAPLVIEGSSFQPPLIGSKKIVNFIVYSLPQVGSLFPVLSVLISAIALKFERK